MTYLRPIDSPYRRLVLTGRVGLFREVRRSQEGLRTAEAVALSHIAVSACSCWISLAVCSGAYPLRSM